MTGAPTRQAVAVGLFVMLGAALLAGGILTVGDLRETFGSKVVVHTEFDNVAGLQVGGNIWFSGVKVGTVRDLAFGQGSEVEVSLAIEPSAAAHIPSDSRARVGSDALLGNKIVILYDGTATTAISDGTVLLAGDVVSNEDMLAIVQENNINLLAITSDLRGLTAELSAGRGVAGRALADDELYDDLHLAIESLATTSDRIGSLTVELSSFSRELNRDGNLPHELATDRDTYASIAASARHLEVATADASTVLAGLDRATGNPQTPVGAALTDEATAAHLKGAVYNLDTSARLLAEDLDALQHSLLLRHYFKKRAREREAAPDEDAAE